MNFIETKRAGLPGWITSDYGEHLGSWQRVGVPGNQVFGKLIIQENGIWLRLVDPLDEVSVSSELIDDGVIIGRIEGGADVTLVGCYEVRRRMSFSGHFAQAFSVDHLLLGAWSNTNERIRLSSMDIEVAFLEDLYPNNAFEIEYEDKGWNLSYGRPDELRAQIANTEIVFRQWGAVNGKGDHEWTANKKAFVSLSFKEPQLIPDVVSHYIKPIRDLASFCVGSQSHVKSVKVVTQFFGSEENKLPLLVRDDYKPQVKHESDYGRQLIRIDDLESNFQFHLSSWLSSQERYRDILSLYFGVLYGRNMYQQNRFLNLSQAAEALGREKSGSRKIHLRKCLEHLWENAATIMTEIAAPKSLWLNSVVNSRNYFTHYNPKKKEKAFHGQDLRRLEAQLSVLLRCNFLDLLGFTVEEIPVLVRRLDVYSILRDQLKNETDSA